MIILLYSLFAALSGLIEAVLYSRRAAEAFTRNEHIEMMLQRISVVLLPAAGVMVFIISGSWVYFVAEHVTAALLFPMVHDEAYNFSRLWIDASSNWPADHDMRRAYRASRFYSLHRVDRWALGYAWAEYRYGYQSATTTARNDFNGWQRSLMAASGLVLYSGALLFLLT